MKKLNDIIPDLDWLWKETRGAPSIRVAIIDGMVNKGHTSFKGANLEIVESYTGISAIKNGDAAFHGTHIASIILGQHNSNVEGIAPDCTGLNFPVYHDDSEGNVKPCSQLDLARTVLQAVEAGAHLINISGGELNNTGKAHELLEKAMRRCSEKNVLVIAAAGNDGCACLHIPGALESVLVVGAMDEHGNPLDFSNWGSAYWPKGILAPGENIPGAIREDETTTNTGTSYATALVTGIAALLLSVQLKEGRALNPLEVRKALMESADGCGDWESIACQKLLSGRLNVKGAYSFIQENKGMIMQKIDPNRNPVPASGMPVMEMEQVSVPSMVSGLMPSCAYRSGTQEESSVVDDQAAQVQPSDCGCNKGSEANATAMKKAVAQTPQLVYALGSLSYDLVSEARRDSISQHTGGNPNDPAQLLKYLDDNPWEAASITWTLSLDATPVYAIQPYGAFAADGYSKLREFLKDQLKHGADRISVPGFLAGSTRLMSGQIVPVIALELRCMYNWNTAALVGSIFGKPPAAAAKEAGKQGNEQQKQAIVNFLERVYHELRNLGTSPEDRSINYAATNALNAAGIFAEALKDSMQLDAIEVERSPICRMDSDCWDVKLIFFDPEKQFHRARKVYRFTVDVSDVCPVMVGAVRSWYIK